VFRPVRQDRCDNPQDLEFSFRFEQGYLRHSASVFLGNNAPQDDKGFRFASVLEFASPILGSSG
jgi:hypothetical protein